MSSVILAWSHPHEPPSMAKHIVRVNHKCYAVMASMPGLAMPSLDTALKLYEAKIKPLQVYAPCASLLTMTDLLTLDKPLTRYAKRKSAKYSCICVDLDDNGGVDWLVSYFRAVEGWGLWVPAEVWRKYNESKREGNWRMVERGNYEGPAFNNNSWKKPNNKARHWFTRATQTKHEFHHVFCKNKCYQPDATFCRLCGRECGLFHVDTCSARNADEGLPEFLDRTDYDYEIWKSSNFSKIWIVFVLTSSTY